MNAEKHRVRQEDASAARDYLRKAGDNHSQMVAALQAGNYNAAGTLALQCAISSADAICVHEQGVRSASEDHRDVCGLVDSITIHDAREKARLLSRIIGRKHMIQYERRHMRKAEAEEIVKSASRFHQWVSEHMR
jgi:hypothetical protein